jgi:hypothetical protein
VIALARPEEPAAPDMARPVTDLLGPKVHADGALSRALRKEAARAFDKHIGPLIDAHWPALRGERFYAKFRIAVENVYGAGPYTVLMLSPRRPAIITALLRGAQMANLDPMKFVGIVERALPFVCSTFLPTERRRISLAAAFIAIADEALDEHLHHVEPKDRGRHFAGILEGTIEPVRPALALLRAITVGLREGLRDDERRELDAALAMCVKWAEAEAKNLAGEPDPSGWCWRLDGILGGIDGLSWSVRRFITDADKQWMYGVSELVQALDDLLDLEKDRAAGLVTPAMTGKFTLASVEKKLRETEAQVRDIARAGGLTDPRYVEMAVKAYRYQIRDVVDLMLDGVAA